MVRRGSPVRVRKRALQKPRVAGLFCVGSICRSSNVGQVWSPLWSLQVENPVKRGPTETVGPRVFGCSGPGRVDLRPGPEQSYAETGTGVASGAFKGSSGSKCGSHWSQAGGYQVRSPRSVIVAGSSTP